jgi:hypothetical protein
MIKINTIFSTNLPDYYSARKNSNREICIEIVQIGSGALAMCIRKVTSSVHGLAHYIGANSP